MPPLRHLGFHRSYKHFRHIIRFGRKYGAPHVHFCKATKFRDIISIYGSRWNQSPPAEMRYGLHLTPIPVKIVSKSLEGRPPRLGRISFAKFRFNDRVPQIVNCLLAHFTIAGYVVDRPRRPPFAGSNVQCVNFGPPRCCRDHRYCRSKSNTLRFLRRLSRCIVLSSSKYSNFSISLGKYRRHPHFCTIMSLVAPCVVEGVTTFSNTDKSFRLVKVYVFRSLVNRRDAH